MTVLPNRLLKLLGFVALLVPLSTASHAAPTISEGYYQEAGQNSSACSNVFSCVAAFTAVPQGKTLIVTNVSCSFIVSSTNATINTMYLASSAGGAATYLDHRVALTTATWRRFLSNTEVTKIYRAGQRPAVLVAFTAPQSLGLFCHISGLIRPFP